MQKVISYAKEHFVETIGLAVIIVLVIFISYLKFYRKTYTCTSKETDSSVTVYQRYVIKQKRNKIKYVGYKYVVTSPSKEQVKQISAFYEDLIEKNPDIKTDNFVTLKYKGNKLTLSYIITQDELEENEMYKSTRHLVKVLKASGFTCK